ncbi:MAG: DUF4332 domain-containing protein, partial [Halobacteriales archaeon]|nr:DUF4332 domain-containing protein [Halobacteriales archaeon]
ATKEAMDKLRAVLDYIPEEAARRLPGDDQDDYDALTRRLSRTVAVKSTVRRRVIVEAPESFDAEDEPVQAPMWEPPADEVVEEPIAPPPPDILTASEPAHAEQEPARSEPEWIPSSHEAVTVVEAVGGPELDETSVEDRVAGDEQQELGSEDFFDVTGKPSNMDVQPVEPDVNLNEREWRSLEPGPETEPATETFAEPEPEPAPAAAEEEAFEQVELPPEPRTEVAAAEGELHPEAATEFEVEEVEEEGSPATSEFEVVEEEAVVEEGEEPAYQVNDFTLYVRETRRGGKPKPSYFFSAEPVPDAKPAGLPDGYEVLLNENTGVPVVRKSSARILPVRDIEGLGPVMAERLEKAGIRTTRDLLHIDPREVSGATGISERLLANYRAMADLLQVATVQPDQASAMVYAGVRNVQGLIDATPSDLAKGMHQAATDFQLHLRGKITAPKVKGWQEKAKKL